MTDNKEREAFEAAWSQAYPLHEKTVFTRSLLNPHGYAGTRINDGWKMWQARAALAASQEKAEPGNLFSYELMDRAHCIQDTFHSLITDHPAAHLCKDAIEKVGDALGDLYQAAGNAYHRAAPVAAQASEPVAAWMTEDGRVATDETKRNSMPQPSKDAYCIPLFKAQPSAEAVRNAALEEVEQLCAQQTKFWEEAARAEESVGPLYHSACAKAAQSVFIKDRVHSLKSQSAPPQPAEQPNAAPADEWEIRNDGKRVRKDRWETGIRNIVTIMGGVREEFEVPEVVETIRKLLTGDAKGPVLSWFTFPSASPAALTERDIETMQDVATELSAYLELYPTTHGLSALCLKFRDLIARAQGEQTCK